jgi:acetyltransferase-like isoleucine patch superfamily enzyme
MRIFNLPPKKLIPYYDDFGGSYFINIKGVARERKMGVIKYLFLKFKFSTIQSLANNCPFNSVRVKLHRMKGAHIGKNVYIGRRVFIDNLYPDFIYLEDGVHLHSECVIISHFNPPKQFSNLFEASANPVVIKAGAIVGLRAIIMPGVSVGQNAMVTAGSIVMKNVAPFTMVQGNPARKILNFEHLM